MWRVRRLGHKCLHLPALVCALSFRRYKPRRCCPLRSSIHHWWWPKLGCNQSGPAGNARDRKAFQHCSYNSFAAIKTAWDDEESRCLCFSRVDRKEHFGSRHDLRIFIKIELAGAVSQTNNHGRWKMDCTQQHLTQAIVVRSWWVTRSPKRICIQRKWCLVCGGIGMVSCTLSCFRAVRLSTPRNTALN